MQLRKFESKFTFHVDTDMPKVFIRLLKQMQDEQSRFLEHFLRENAEPPIKDEITKGKLRWRGIRLCIQEVGPFETVRWLSQRGKRISPNFSDYAFIKPLDK